MRWFQKIPHDDDWQLHEPFWFAVVVDGRRTREPVMRKRINGKWVYRALSETEASRLNSELAW